MDYGHIANSRRRIAWCVLFALTLGFSRGAFAEGQESPPSTRPNIVLIAIDTLRADHLGCYGYHRSTSPTIDRLAASGVLFENCYSAASWTLPSFMSMFTGLLPAAHGCIDAQRRLPESIPMLAEVLSGAGYFSAGLTSNPVLSAKHGFGRGFATYDDYSIFLDAELALLAAGPDAGAGRVNELVTGRTVTLQAKGLVDKAAASDQPAFLFLVYFDPHDSYVPPPPFNSAFSAAYSGPIDGRNMPDMRTVPPTGADLDQLIGLYNGEIAFDDKALADLLQHIDEMLGPNTITILVSDHGEAFGERGMLLHGNGVYREEVHVPMIWRWPQRFPKGHRVAHPVGLVDIVPTLLDLAEIDAPRPVQGVSLRGALEGEEAAADRSIISERGMASFPGVEGATHHVALTKGHWRLHAFYDATADAPFAVKLFNVVEDPAETVDQSEAQPDEVRVLRGALEEAMRASRMLQEHHRSTDGEVLELSETERKRLKTLGYIVDPASDE